MTAPGTAVRRPQYHLRFQVLPSPSVAEEAAALADYCRRHGIDEVVLFLAAEEAFPGFLLEQEQETWLATLDTAARILREQRVTVSINPWTTVGHWDGGRVDRHRFTPMVSARGEQARLQVSIACPLWRSWIVQLYGALAELRPRVLWIEDDFRYHNHAPLRWGSGFDEILLQRFRERAGSNASRKQIVAAMTAPGEPHPWRGLLLDTWRDAQLDVVRMLRAEVARRSHGATRLGLMTSRPAHHAVEGRSWRDLFTAAGGPEVAHRPHFAAYSDVSGHAVASEVALLALQRRFLPDQAEVAPEIENAPHTAWSKSDVQTWSHMVTAAISGADALLLDLHPFYCRVPDRASGVGPLLDATRPALEWITEHIGARPVTDGVGIVWPDTVSRHARAHGDIASLAVDPVPGATYLLRNGVPVSGQLAGINALFGQAAWALSDAALEELLRGRLLVDGHAVGILTDRGYGELLGVQAARVVERDANAAACGAYALEQVTAAGEGAARVPAGILLSVNQQPALTQLIPAADAEVWTDVVTPTGRYWGAGRVVYANRVGGKVAIHAAHALDRLPGSDEDRDLLQAAVRRLQQDAGNGEQLPEPTGGPHLVPSLVRSQAGRTLFVANGSSDEAEVRVRFPTEAPDAAVTLLAPLRRPVSLAVARHEDTITAPCRIPPRGYAVLTWPG